MKYSFSEQFEAERYQACLEEIGVLIERLRRESGCSVKPLLTSVHISHRMLKRVCQAKW